MHGIARKSTNWLQGSPRRVRQPLTSLHSGDTLLANLPECAPCSTRKASRSARPHENCPKKDWKDGDVPGVLELIRPLDGDVERARAGLRGTAILMGVTFGSLLGASGLILVMTNRRRNLARTETVTQA
jgi:hypothetical protein